MIHVRRLGKNAVERLLKWVHDLFESDEAFAQRMLEEFASRWPERCLVCVFDAELRRRGVEPGPHRCEERIRQMRPDKLESA